MASIVTQVTRLTLSHNTSNLSHCGKGTILQCTESVQNSILHHKILHVVK